MLAVGVCGGVWGVETRSGCERGWLESLGGLLFYCRQVKCPTSCQAVLLIHCSAISGWGVQCALGGQVLCWVSLPSWVELGDGVAPDLLLGNLYPHFPIQWQAGASSELGTCFAAR